MISSIIVFLIVLSILVLVHEFGHFLVAKKANVLVEEFGIGLPPRIIGKKIGETIYSVNLLPFGGFVKLHGESSEEKLTDPKRAFLNKSASLRTLIIVAGVFMNFVLAIFAFSTFYFFKGIPRTSEDVKVLDVASNSPAQEAGFVVGDIVRKVNQESIKSTEEFINAVEKKKGSKIELEIERKQDGQIKKLELSATPREKPPQGEGALGVVISNIEIYFPSPIIRPFVGIYYGFKDAILWGKTVALGFVTLIKSLFSGVVPKDIAGPVGIFAVTSEAAKFGILSLINFVGVLSVNLAVLNIIPFPALDGGRLLFVIIEKIAGRKVLPKVESAIHTVGMIILLILIFAITAHDIQRLIAAGSISGFIESILK